MAQLTGTDQLASNAETGIRLLPQRYGWAVAAYPPFPTASVPQPMVGGRLLYIADGKIKALPEATP